MKELLIQFFLFKRILHNWHCEGKVFQITYNKNCVNKFIVSSVLRLMLRALLPCLKVQILRYLGACCCRHQNAVKNKLEAQTDITLNTKFVYLDAFFFFVLIKHI